MGREDPTRGARGVEAEVRANVLGQGLGDGSGGTVADLDLPTDFVSRVVDRVIRASFAERYRRVEGEVATGGIPRAAGFPARVAVVEGVDARGWAGLEERAPAAASFRSPATDGAELARARLMGAASAEVRRRLARDGLLATVAWALGAGVVKGEGERAWMDAGIPVDLLEWFEVEGGVRGLGIVGVMEGAERERAGRAREVGRRARCVPRATLEGFSAIAEDGSVGPGVVRLQLPHARHYAGAGDGGCLDVVLGVMREIPGARAVVSTTREHAEALRLAVESRAGEVAVVAQAGAVSQWAGDGGKGGEVAGGAAWLASRFAARREERTTFVPGDDAANAGLGRAGIRVGWSPLVFEGGNVLVAEDARGRVAVVGEAEVWRNRALGLTREQVEAALRVELGVGRVVVVPAASYHVDQEVSLRRVGDRAVAFVADVGRAARMIAGIGMEAIERSGAGRWEDGLAREARRYLGEGRVREFLTLAWTGLTREVGEDGAWRAEFARAFSTGAADSGAGNVGVFLAALDELAGEVAPAEEFESAHQQAVVRSYARRREDRRRVRVQLETLGWKVVGVPAMPEDTRGVNPLNAVHLPDRVVMPTYGGLYRGMDEAAARVFEAAGGVKVVGVASAESQRREGAVHCSVGLMGGAGRE